jgi:hypothetical protein
MSQLTNKVHKQICKYLFFFFSKLYNIRVLWKTVLNNRTEDRRKLHLTKLQLFKIHFYLFIVKIHDPRFNRPGVLFQSRVVDLSHNVLFLVKHYFKSVPSE